MQRGNPKQNSAAFTDFPLLWKLHKLQFYNGGKTLPPLFQYLALLCTQKKITRTAVRSHHSYLTPLHSCSRTAVLSIHINNIPHCCTFKTYQKKYTMRKHDTLAKLTHVGLHNNVYRKIYEKTYKNIYKNICP